MLHSDTNGNGVYEYLMIPGVDLPVVYNGGVVTIPVSINGSAIGTDPLAGGADVTAEATADMGGEGMDMTPAPEATEAAADDGSGTGVATDPVAPETPAAGVEVPATTAP
jgi:hypothetical protein